MSIYGFWQGPTYRPSTRDELFGAALDMPMSAGATFWDQAKGGALESFGLGSAIRDAKTPDGAPLAAGRYERPEQFEARRDAFAAENKVLNEEAYKTSPYFRDGVPWDASMTEDKAAALATMYDAKRVREYFAEKRPFTSFFGNLAGQATDPINYIPVAGPAVKAAAVARMGVVKGIAATAALDAAANTAIAGLATRETRRSLGDDVSWQMMVSEIATAALLGTAFGTVGGLLERRAGIRADALRSEAEVKVNTLRATQEARIALNEAIGGLANDGEVRLSPNGIAPIERMAREVDARSAVDTITPKAVDQPQPVVRIEPALEQLDSTLLSERGIQPDEPRILASKREDLSTNVDTYRPTENVPTLRIGGKYFTGGMHADALEKAIKTFGADSPEIKAFNDAENPLEFIGVLRPSGGIFKSKPPEFRSGVSGDRGAGVKEAVGTAVEREARRSSRGVDASPARPEPLPTGRAEAEAKVAKPENYKALADQYRVDPEAGTFPEEAELHQLAQAGRLSDEDMAVLDDADAAFQDGVSYGDALKSVVGCLL